MFISNLNTFLIGKVKTRFSESLGHDRKSASSTVVTLDGGIDDKKKRGVRFWVAYCSPF
jgi:hypothetical protein